MKKKTAPDAEPKPTNIWLRILRNKYAVTALLFGVWMMFFDSNSMLENISLRSQINRLKRNKLFYENQINQNRQRLVELQTDDANLEKFAREQYLMKRANEDIFIIEDN